MTPNEYQKLAMRTSPINKIGLPTARYNGTYHGVLGLCSEAGEVAGIFQKVYQGHEIEPEHLKKELGDCLWMIAEICEAWNFKLEDIMQLNIDKLKARYPEGFEVERSLHRAEGDI